MASSLDPILHRRALLDERLPIWAALSEFFLDTKLDDAQLNRIAQILATSPYSESEIEAILRDEVSPLCSANLRSLAGEWQGFDESWLREKLAPRIGARPRFLSGLFWSFNPARIPWEKTRARLRRQPSPTPSILSRPFEAHLRFYTITEHLATIVGSVPHISLDHSLKGLPGRRMLAYGLAIEASLIASHGDDFLIETWRKCIAVLRRLHESPEKSPDGQRFISCAYVLAGLTWAQVADQPGAETVRQVLMVTIHPLDFTIRVIRVDEWLGHDSREVMQLLNKTLCELSEQ